MIIKKCHYILNILFLINNIICVLNNIFPLNKLFTKKI